MNISAAGGAGKWPYGRRSCDKGRMARYAAILVVLLSWGGVPAQAAKVPLPRPRPPEAPAAAAPADTEPEGRDSAAPEAPPAAAAAPPASPCRLALTEDIAIAPSIPPIKGPGACGGDDLVRLEAVVAGPGRRIAVKPAAILRCPMAAAVADWVRSDLVPLLGDLVEIDNFDSYECRGRNRVRNAKLSEHGRANALDVRSLKLANGTMISLTDRTVARELREKVLASVCARFSTVLGPGSDWYHEDHIHLDLAARRNAFKMCQWNVYDPLPAVAPLLPAERPPEAPPRPETEEAQEAAPPGADAPAEAAPRDDDAAPPAPPRKQQSRPRRTVRR